MDEVEKMLMELERENKNKTSFTTTVSLNNDLKIFSEFPWLKSKENIFYFGGKNKTSMPEQYKVAAAILAVPSSTQVSFKRLFSSLKYILSPHCYNLQHDCVNNVLIIQENYRNKIIRNKILFSHILIFNHYRIY